MKLLIATAALVLAAAPALAQTSAPAAPATTAPAAAASPAPAGPLTADTPIETLMASPASREAVLKSFPKLDENPAYEQFKVMGLRQLVAMLNGAIPMEKVDQVDKDLAAIK